MKKSKQLDKFFLDNYMYLEVKIKFIIDNIVKNKYNEKIRITTILTVGIY